MRDFFENSEEEEMKKITLMCLCLSFLVGMAWAQDQTIRLNLALDANGNSLTAKPAKISKRSTVKKQKKKKRPVSTPVATSTPSATASVTASPTPSVSVTPTATLVVKKVQKKSGWEGQIGFDVRFAPSVGAGTLPMGFQFLNTKSAEPEFFLQVKYKYVALNASVNLGEQDVTMQTYGSGLNTVHVSTPIASTLKCYPLDGISDAWSVYPFIGIGVEYTKVQGNFSMGGFKFDTSGGDNFTPVIPIGIEFGKDIRFSLGYEVRTVALDTVLPGVGTLEFQQNGNWVFGGSIPF